jgi:hypothetical protein
MSQGNLEAAAVGTGKELLFVLLPATPDRPHSMNDIARREGASTGNHGISRGATVRVLLLCLGHDTRAASAVNRPVDPTAAGQATIGGVHHGIGVLLSNISNDELELAWTDRYVHHVFSS